MSESSARSRNEYVASFALGLKAIAAFGPGAPLDMTLSEVARRSGLSRASARRFLLTLCELGYVASDGRTFRLLPKILELGYAFLASRTLDQLARPHLQDLVRAYGETCSLSVLSEGSALIVARLMPEGRVLKVSLSVGSRLPLVCSAMGRVLLAGLSDAEYRRELDAAAIDAEQRRRLDRIRDRVLTDGYVVVDQEFAPGVRSVAVPVRDVEGRVAAAVSICADASRTLDAGYPQPFLEGLLRLSRELVVPVGTTV